MKVKKRLKSSEVKVPPINARKVLEDALGKEERTKLSFYLNKSLYLEFQAECEHEGVAISRLVEALMKGFLVARGKRRN